MLCESCSKITLDRLLLSKNGRVVIAGSYMELVNRTKDPKKNMEPVSSTDPCRLCKIVMSSLTFQHARFSLPQTVEEEKAKYGNDTAIMMYIHDSESPGDAVQGFCKELFDVQPDPGLLRTTIVDLWYGSGLKLSLSAHNADPQHPVFARKTVQENIDDDLSFAEKCLQICETTHMGICDKPISRAQVRYPPRRLYNIKERRLQSFDPDKSEPVKYTTLSYLWGNAVPEQIRTIADGSTADSLLYWSDSFRKNIPPNSMLGARCKPHGLNLEDPHLVPPVYRRAVELTKRLKIDYIWIDSICIIQGGDGGIDQALHFNDFVGGVGQIYENSVLTLTAIGPDASVNMDGPRKVYTSADPDTAWLSDGKIFLTARVGVFGSPLVPTKQVDEPQRWEGRGWPFQEQILSRRLLYFTQTQQYFECCKVFYEDGEFSAALQVRKKIRTVDSSKDILDQWGQIVADYTPRQLGRYTDRLNGISSVATQLSNRAQNMNLSPCNFDYPSGIFPTRVWRDLFWVQCGNQNITDYLGYKKDANFNNTNISSVRWGGASPPPPPTWSWGMWKGSIYFPSPLHCRDPEDLMRDPKQGLGPHEKLTADDIVVRTQSKEDTKEGDLRRTTLVVKEPRLIHGLEVRERQAPTPADIEQGRFYASGLPRYAFNDYAHPVAFSTLSTDSASVGWGAIDVGMAGVGQKVTALVLSVNLNCDGDFSSWNVLLLGRKEDAVHLPMEEQPVWAKGLTVHRIGDSQYVRVGMGEVWAPGEMQVGETLEIV